MQDALNKVSIIRMKYDLIEDESKFNIFSLLRNSGDEVNLHSRFIFELISPDGSHRKKNEFLILLLRELNIQDFKLENIVVTREKWKIDLLIRNSSKQAIVIENKIWAEDQPDQLYNYYTKMKNQGFIDIKLYYLTPFGASPSEKSVKKLPENIKSNIVNVSYSLEILEWLDASIGKCASNPIIRENLIQYKNLINNLTGQSTNKNMKDDIIELLAKGENILDAQKIASNWVHVNWHAEWLFWEDLEKELKKKYKIVEVNRYSRDLLNSVYYKSRNRNLWYGVMCELKMVGEYGVCLYVERGFGNLYYGITITKEGKRNTIFKKNNESYSKEVEQISENTNEWWLGYREFDTKINFTSFNDKNTLKLLNEEHRRLIVGKLLEELENYIQEFNEIKLH